MKDILIIGAGPVGLYAWSCAGMLHLSGYIIEGNDTGGGQPRELFSEKYVYDVPGILKITGKEYANNLLKQAQTNGQKIESFFQTNILKLEEIENGFEVTLTNEIIIQIRTILITTGNGVFSPIKLEHLNPKIRYQNLNYLIENIEQYRDKKIVIFGGGDSAVDWANHFVEDGLSNDVTIVHRRNAYRAKENNVQKLKINKIKELKSYQVASINTIEDVISDVVLTNIENNNSITISADYFIVQYGAKIYSSIINNWDLEFMKMHKIIIQSGGQTNKPNIFAAGNACYYKGKYYNMVTGFGEAINALINITKILYGEKYHPGYLGDDITSE